MLHHEPLLTQLRKAYYYCMDCNLAYVVAIGEDESQSIEISKDGTILAIVVAKNLPAACLECGRNIDFGTSQAHH